MLAGLEHPNRSMDSAMLAHPDRAFSLIESGSSWQTKAGFLGAGAVESTTMDKSVHCILSTLSYSKARVPQELTDYSPP